ncbi:ribosomal small subunit pseudouridine synthase A [Pelagirhabdus alkalitolerans]|uniref:Pseudouridine synthase n=1 Tax=Pelagirhabdus alkalitolerans TaxID=1612202 RepID=A0A1G6HHV8_9BACI|nr:pseudouridine synthase [Pelagirhabdus alkalitolerans]SDB93839.1 ribosomal small subunit pseudouridine synthase A [Pelagirhabdus alkalitolerans]
MRLDKLLANSGFGSRKEVKDLLKQSHVRVNEKTVKQGKVHIDLERDEVEVKGEKVVYEEFVYFMLNKPSGVVSATEDTRDKTVIDLLDSVDKVKAPFPVGRLDKDTEGLLLLTNDGKLAHQLLSPKKDVGKYYYAEVGGALDTSLVEQFKEGIELDDGYLTKPSELTILSSGTRSEIELMITEGKFHQVKRMFKAIGKNVVYLKRYAMGDWILDPKLEKGSYRRLTQEEIDYLKSLRS